MIKLSSFEGVASIGDIVTTQRTATEAGNVLLPLSGISRNLTTAEVALYPLLAAALPDRLSYTTPATANNEVLVNSTMDGDQIALRADASVFYFASGTDLKKYTRATDTQSVVKSNSASDQVKSIACSADGTIVAFTLFDNSATIFSVFVSNDSAASFTEVFTGATGVAATDTSTVYIPPDGSIVVWTVPDGSSDMNYGRIDDPAASLVIDDTRGIAANLTFASTSTGGRTSFSDDGLTFAFSYANGGTAAEYITDYTENAGVSFTRINAYPLDQNIPASQQENWQVQIDGANPERMVIILGRTDVVNGVFYSNDKGLNWTNIPPPDNSLASIDGGSSTSGGWFNALAYRPTFRNGYVNLVDRTGFMWMVFIDVNGASEILDKLYADNGGTGSPVNDIFVAWAADELSMGVAGSVSDTELPLSGGIMTIGNRLPLAQLFSNSKIVADAP